MSALTDCGCPRCLACEREIAETTDRARKDNLWLAIEAGYEFFVGKKWPDYGDDAWMAVHRGKDFCSAHDDLSEAVDAAWKHKNGERTRSVKERLESAGVPDVPEGERAANRMRAARRRR